MGTAMIWLLRRRLVLATVLCGTSLMALPLTAQAATTLPTGCTSVCVSASDFEGPGSPVPRATIPTVPVYNGKPDLSNFNQYQYTSTPTLNLDNNAESIRMISTVYDDFGNPYNRACFYATAGWVTLRSSVASSHNGWYNNSSTDLSSERVTFGAQSACP